MNLHWDTDSLDPITEEIRRWPPVTHAGARARERPARRSSRRRRLFPRGWRDVMYAAWTLVAVLVMAVLIVAGCEVLVMLGRSG